MPLTRDFVKSHGLGNDYLVMTRFPGEMTPERIRLVCDRNFGAGSDGILLLTQAKEPFGLRIFNPDGSEAEKSGNGLRIFAKFLFEYGYAAGRIFRIQTLGGMVTAEVYPDKSNRVDRVKVDMGRATVDPEAVGLSGQSRPFVEELLELAPDVRIKGTAISVGNPHFVFFRDEIDEKQMREWGPRIENHPLFPKRINTQMVRVTGPSEIEIRIWERGAGWTLASGSSSCAAAAVSVMLGKVKSPVRVRMPGGTLFIDISPEQEIRMEGPVSEVMSADFSPDFLARIASVTQ
ncbi:MAG: diaminopimelate epimerase [Nitrospirae bacterium]|jgi:diaminopimelate epimerase|nr:diaminopimelate epimerase [Nitrospirota bacterium]